MSDLLLELRSEEIPARMQAKGAELLRGAVESRLEGRGLNWKTAEAFATPRRLALIVRGLPGEVPKSREERRGPRVGAPEKALAGFLRSTDLTREMLEVRGEGADQAYFAVWDNLAQPLHEVLAVELPQALRAMTWPKSMRWGHGNFRWVRPLRSIVCIVDDDTGSRVVELDVERIPCGRVTCGHPYMAPDAFTVESVDKYEDRLEEAKVILRADLRRESIRQAVDHAVVVAGSELEPVYRSDLIHEITGLVEWPVAYVGQIDDVFSDLPNDLLHASMTKHQKFISLWNGKTERIDNFVAVADIQVEKGDRDRIQKGYERVLRARLSDAQFFWENDKRTGIEEMRRGLSGMVFHSALGDMEARTERISGLAEAIIGEIGGLSSKMTHRAGEIAKADLRSETVREFPELQGIVGALLAKEAGENEHVCSMVARQYLPSRPDGKTTPGPAALILADRADMLWGFFAVGERPTGSGDPYALRRTALAILRTLIEKDIYFSLRTLISLAEKQYEKVPLPAREDTSEAVVKFMLQRLHVHMCEGGPEDPEWIRGAFDRLRVHLCEGGLEDPAWIHDALGRLDAHVHLCEEGLLKDPKQISDALKLLRMHLCEEGLEDPEWILNTLERLGKHVRRCEAGLEDPEGILNTLKRLGKHVHLYEKGLEDPEWIRDTLERLGEHVHRCEAGLEDPEWILNTLERLGKHVHQCEEGLEDSEWILNTLERLGKHAHRCEEGLEDPEWISDALKGLRMYLYEEGLEDPKWISDALKGLRMHLCEGGLEDSEWISDVLKGLRMHLCKEGLEDPEWIRDTLERLPGHMCDGRPGGLRMRYRHDLVTAAARQGAENDPRWFARLVFHLDQWFRLKLREPEQANLLAAYRRVASILDAEGDGEAWEPDRKPPPPEPEEHSLAKALDLAKKEIEDNRSSHDPQAVLEVLAKLSDPVHLFFKNVHVNDPNPKLRLNRLHLLAQVRAVMEKVADFGAIED